MRGALVLGLLLEAALPDLDAVDVPPELNVAVKEDADENDGTLLTVPEVDAADEPLKVDDVEDVIVDALEPEPEPEVSEDRLTMADAEDVSEPDGESVAVGDIKPEGVPLKV